MFPQVDTLLADFEGFLKAFDRLKPFHGGQIENHRKTIQLVRAAQKPVDVLGNPVWYQSLRATLVDWDMDARGSDLADTQAIQASFTSLHSQIEALQDIRLENVGFQESILYERKIWPILRDLKIGRQNTRLVINTKALHHVLPDLVPPMDRAYTIKFFFGQRILTKRNEQSLFERMWPKFCHIARERSAVMLGYRSHGMHTSIPKMIDNAIIAYVKTGGQP